MRVLLITTKHEDYLEDAVIHGFKELLGKQACDYPMKPMLYDDFTNKSSIRGGGFTLYGLLEKSLKSETDKPIEQVLENGSFDVIIFTSILRQYKLYYKLYPMLSNKKLYVLDGEDADILFPYWGKFVRKSFFWTIPKPHQKFFYFKRELTGNTISSYYFRLLPLFLARWLKPHKNIHPISFAIPKEKITNVLPDKTKMFTQHIVDEEIVKKLPGKNSRYTFSSEKEYYYDIQCSSFGITMRRAGWDCLRHYEIAANGAVICFKNLELKPATCAPHGLIPGYNCLSYKNYDDLMNKINSLSSEGYNQMLAKSLEWIKQNTTIERAKQLINFIK